MALQSEYLYGVLPTTPFFDVDAAQKVAQHMERENLRAFISATDKARTIEVLYSYLFYEREFLREQQPFVPENTGAYLALRQINNALQNYWNRSTEPKPGSELDLV